MKILKKALRKILLTTTVRNIIKKYLVGNLGKVVEEDDKLICYVKKNKIKKEKYEYSIMCNGIEDKELAKTYNLDKPVYYVIEGINITDKKVYIYNYHNEDCNITIKNCNFEFGFGIQAKCDCTLDNNHIRAFYLLMIDTKNLTIKNMDLTNEVALAGADLSIKLGATFNINLINANIGKEKERTKVSMIAYKNIELINSTVNGKKVECDAKQQIITDDNSSLNATDKIILKTDNIDKINISCNTLVYNDNVIEQEENIVGTIEYKDDDLTNKRLELINLLKNLKDICENTSIGEIRHKPFSKVKK